MKKILVLTLVVLSLAFACYAAEYDGYIVKISDNTASILAENVSMFSGATLASDLTDSETVELITDEIDSVMEINSDHMLVKVDDMQTLEDLISLGIVEGYEENFYLELHGYDVTQNYNYNQQKWYLDDINAEFAWNAGIYGEGATVAVIDSGVYAHEDFGNNLLPGKNYVEGLDETDTNDEYNHGTHVAGIIAARCNSLATVGIAFKSKIVPLKVTNDRTLTIDYVLKAIYDAVDYYECDVINMSFGHENESARLREAINYAIDKNVIVVASAGNGGNSGYAYPASYDEVISVANSREDGTVSSSSQKNDMVDITAPGTYIMALSNNGSVTGSPYPQGTSFSAPMVSAVAALAKSINPSISQQEFQSLIKQSADASYLASSGQGSTAWGAGMLDIEALIKLMLAGKRCYVSKPSTVNNEDFICVTNLSNTDDIEDCVITITEYNADGSIKYTKDILSNIPASSSVEISLTEYGFSTFVEVKTSYDRIPGDVNGDGIVTTRDASVILRYIAQFEVDVPESVLDVNADGWVTISDASAILRHCAGFEVELH